jgi:hypothetical protein
MEASMPKLKVRIPLQTPGNIIWPHRCACCGDVPDTFEESKVNIASTFRQLTLTLRVPYCSACKQHARARGRRLKHRIQLAFWLVLIGPVLGMVGYVVSTDNLGTPPWLGGIVAMLLVVGFFLLWRPGWQRASKEYRETIERFMKPTCVAEGQAVWVSTDNVNLYFRFENPDLAEEFRSANGGAWWGG